MKTKLICPKCGGDSFVHKVTHIILQKYYWTNDTTFMGEVIPLVQQQTDAHECVESRVYCNSCGYEFSPSNTTKWSWKEIYKSLEKSQEEGTNKEGEEK